MFGLSHVCPTPPPGTLITPFIRQPWSTVEKAVAPTPVLLAGEPQGRGSLVGCRLWGRTESDTTEATQQQQQHRAALRAVCPRS